MRTQGTTKVIAPSLRNRIIFTQIRPFRLLGDTSITPPTEAASGGAWG